MHYAYPCVLKPEEGGGYYVVFPDVRGALTCGDTRAQALDMARDALTVALAGYVLAKWDIPTPSPLSEGQELVALDPMPAAKLALYIAMRRQDISEAELANRMNVSEANIPKLITPDRYTHLTTIMNALRAVGHSIVIQDGVTVHGKSDDAKQPAA